MNGRRSLAARWPTYVGAAAFVGVGVVAAVGVAAAQPGPVDPAVPPPPPVGAPYVPLVPGEEVLQQPGQMIGDLWNMGTSGNLMENLFPMPAAPPTPVRDMPMGPPPPPDPRFFPPTA